MMLFSHCSPISYLFLFSSAQGGEYKALEDQSGTCHFPTTHLTIQHLWFVTTQPSAAQGMEDAVGRQGTVPLGDVLTLWHQLYHFTNPQHNWLVR